MNIECGYKVFFESEKRPYTVRAYDERYVICTKPFNPKRTVLYTILDLKQQVRGTNNLVFNSYNYAIQEDIERCLKDLQCGMIEVSHRNRIALDIKQVAPNTNQP